MSDKEHYPELIKSFIEVCPSLRDRWIEHLDYWGDDERGEFNDISVLAHLLVDKYSEGYTNEFESVFSLVEQLLADGDEETRVIITIGLIEDIQNIASHTEFGSGVFIRWLGPKTKDAWNLVNKMWEGKSSLMEVVRDEITKDKST